MWLGNRRDIFTHRLVSTIHPPDFLTVMTVAFWRPDKTKLEYGGRSLGLNSFCGDRPTGTRPRTCYGPVNLELGTANGLGVDIDRVTYNSAKCSGL